MNVQAPVVELIAVDAIDADDRLRSLDQATVELIAASLPIDGLRNAIEVRKVGKRYHLIAGGHRLEAVRYLGWEQVPAIVKKVGALEARLLEIDENLFRRELSPLDRACFWPSVKKFTRRFTQRRNTAGIGSPIKPSTLRT